MQDYNPKEYQSAAAEPVTTEALRPAAADTMAVASFMGRVYGVMCAGLLVTALVAFLVASSESLVRMFVMNPIMMILLCVLEVGLVIGLSWGIKRMSAATALAGFIAFAVLNGVTLSALLLSYSRTSLTSTFLVCSGTFAALSVFALVTKKDLGWVGNFCFIGLIGLIIASVVNMFIASSLFAYVLSCIGVLVFAGLTAYDTQMLKQMGAESMDHETAGKLSVIGALTLYLDFINLFISMLRVMSGRD